MNSLPWAMSVFCTLIIFIFINFQLSNGRVLRSGEIVESYMNGYREKHQHLNGKSSFYRSLSAWTNPVSLDPTHWSYILDHGSLRSFPTYDEANILLDSFLVKYERWISRFQSGESFEGKPLWSYRIGKRNPKMLKKTIYDPDTKQCLIQDPPIFDLSSDYISFLELQMSTTIAPQTLLTALHHAREPAALTVVLYFVGRLLELGTQPYNATIDRAKSPEMIVISALCRYFLENQEIIVLPFVNPDAYIAMEKTKKFSLRKNRRVTCPNFISNSERQGVDLNRNYNYSFAQTHSVCDEQEYEGSYPFSEPETKAVKCLVDSHSFRTALNFHSFGDVWTRPLNCCNNSSLPNSIEKIYEELSISVGVKEFNSVSRISTLGYTTSGEADDWMLGHRGIISMSPEVGKEEFGFWPPQHAIHTTNENGFWRIVDVVMKSGPAISASIQVVNYGNSRSIEIQLTNNGLSQLVENSKLAVLYHANTTTSHVQSLTNSTLISEVYVSEELSNSNDSSLPFIPFPWSSRPKSSRILQSSTTPLEPLSGLLSINLTSLAPRAKGSNLRVPIKQQPKAIAVCVVERSNCRCSIVPNPEHEKLIITPLLVIDYEDILCQSARRLDIAPPYSEAFGNGNVLIPIDKPTSVSSVPPVVSNVLGRPSSMHIQSDSGDSLVTQLNSSNHKNDANKSWKSDLLVASSLKVAQPPKLTITARYNQIWISLFLMSEGLMIIIFIFIFCIIVSTDPEDSKTRFGRMATASSICVTRAFCCFPCCLKLHQKLKAGTTEAPLDKRDRHYQPKNRRRYMDEVDSDVNVIGRTDTSLLRNEVKATDDGASNQVELFAIDLVNPFAPPPVDGSNQQQCEIDGFSYGRTNWYDQIAITSEIDDPSNPLNNDCNSHFIITDTPDAHSEIQHYHNSGMQINDELSTSVGTNPSSPFGSTIS